jgi:hypothetical protein
MRSTGAWLGRLAMAAICLSWVGCGGGDVPDPDSDSSAASNEPSRPARRAAPAEKSDAEGLASNTTPPAESAKPEAAEKPPEAEKPAPATPKADSSGTDEMLKTPPSTGGAPGAPGSSPSAPASPPSSPAAPKSDGNGGSAMGPIPKGELGPGGSAPAPAPTPNDGNSGGNRNVGDLARLEGVVPPSLPVPSAQARVPPVR